jgi:hypothetical protein
MWVDIRYVHLHEHTFLLPLGKMYVTEDQTRRLQDPLSESDTDESTPNKDIQFGYHSASGKHIRITNSGLGAERMNPEDECDDGVAYGAQPLKGLAEFEVKMVSYGALAKWTESLGLVVMTCKKGVPIEPGPGFPGLILSITLNTIVCGLTRDYSITLSLMERAPTTAMLI